LTPKKQKKTNTSQKKRANLENTLLHPANTIAIREQNLAHRVLATTFSSPPFPLAFSRQHGGDGGRLDRYDA